MKDIRINGSNLIVSDQKKVYVYNLSGALVKTLDIAEEVNTANIAVSYTHLTSSQRGN